MEGLSSMLGSLLTEDNAKQISKSTKTDTAEVAQVIAAGIPVLMAAMSKNASTEDGEKALAKALDDHGKTEGSVEELVETADADDGKKIIKHVLGDETTNVMSTISKSTGVKKSAVSSILSKIAPVLLVLLAKNIFFGDNNNEQSASSGLGLSSLLTSMLGFGGTQQSNDGGIAGALLGSLFGMGTQQTQQSNASGSLLGSLLGAGTQQQTQQSVGGELLGALLGGTQQPQQSSAGNDLLGSLLGAGTQQQQPQQSSAGSDLLGSLLMSFLK